MVLFGKRKIIFKTVGNKGRWKEARQVLKSAGIPIMEAGSYESEMPICSCGAKIDRRNYGANGWIDRRVYYVAVRPKDTERARMVLLDAVGGPLESDELVLPEKKPEQNLNTACSGMFEMARDEARHNKTLKSLLKRYFK